MNPQSVRPLKRNVRYVQPNKPLLQSPQTLDVGGHVLRHVRIY